MTFGPMASDVNYGVREMLISMKIAIVIDINNIALPQKKKKTEK